MLEYFSVVWKACGSINLKDRKELLANVLKQEKPELPVGTLTMNTCKHVTQSILWTKRFIDLPLKDVRP